MTEKQIIENITRLATPILEQKLTPTIRGPQAKGGTLEQALGIKQNSRKDADLPECEIKVEAKKTRLFSHATPMQDSFVATYPNKSGDCWAIIQHKGTPRATVYPKNLCLQVDRERKQVSVLHGEKLVDYVPFSLLTIGIENKIKNLCMFECKTHGKGKEKKFSYSNPILFLQTDLEKFLWAIEQNILKLEYRYDKNGKHDHGTAWQIEKKDLHRLYQKSYII